MDLLIRSRVSLRRVTPKLSGVQPSELGGADRDHGRYVRRRDRGSDQQQLSAQFVRVRGAETTPRVIPSLRYATSA